MLYVLYKYAMWHKFGFRDKYAVFLYVLYSVTACLNHVLLQTRWVSALTALSEWILNESDAAGSEKTTTPWPSASIISYRKYTASYSASLLQSQWHFLLALVTITRADTNLGSFSFLKPLRWQVLRPQLCVWALELDDRMGWWTPVCLNPVESFNIQLRIWKMFLSLVPSKGPLLFYSFAF